MENHENRLITTLNNMLIASDYDRYFNYINNLSDKDFMFIMDIAYAIQETNNEINIKELEIKSINEQINALQKNLKTANAETKKQIVLEIKTLGALKNALSNDISNLLKFINNSIPSQEQGLIVKLSTRSPDTSYTTLPYGSKGFVGYVTDIAIYDASLKNKFIKTMENNYNSVYISNYANTLAKQTKLNETSGNMFENVSALPSFRKRLSIPAKKVFENEDTVNEIISFLKKKGGFYTKKTSMKKRKTRRA